MLRKLIQIQIVIALTVLGTVAAVAGDRVRVVSTFTIPADWVEAVGGERIKQHVLVGRNSDMHTFDETPRDLMNLQRADVIFAIGLDLEPWLGRLQAASNADGRLIYLTDALRGDAADLLLAGGEVCPISAHGSAESHAGHAHEMDPHVWLNPNYAALMVEQIEQVLAEADPLHAEYYRQRGRAYRAQLRELDAEIAKQLAVIAAERRILIAHHDTLRYFAKAYDFRIPGSILGTITVEGTEPSARQIVNILALIEQEQVAALFAENSLSGQLVAQVAQEAGLPQPRVLYTGALGQKGSSGENYLAMMRYNAEVIRESLGM